MPRPYGTISSNVWDDVHSQKMSHSSILLRLYLLCCPQSNMLGYYRFYHDDACRHLKFNPSQIAKSLDILRECGLATYYPDFDQIGVHEAFDHYGYSKTKTVDALLRQLEQNNLPASMPHALADHLQALRVRVGLCAPDNASKRLIALLDHRITGLRS